MKEIETERLRLRRWTTEDAEALYACARNPNVGPHAGWKPHEMVEESRRIIDTLFRPPHDVWAITLKESGEIIGSVGLEPDKRRPGVNGKELGYWLAEPYWGRGFMTEAAQATVEYAFAKLSLDILAVCTDPKNTRSQRTIEKCGFVYEGTERRTYRTYTGVVRDSKCYSILREEWENKSSNST